MTLLELLVLCHLAGDWLLQTEFEALNKAKGKFFNRALWAHCAKYIACFVPLLLWKHYSLWWLVWLMATHLFLDRRWPVLYLRRYVTRCSWESIHATFWLTVMVDQVCHLLVLAVMAGWLRGLL